MSEVILKVCGITSLADARLAIEYGATFLGFNFYRPSPRYIEPESARQIITALPPAVTPVGIFVNEPTPDAVDRLMAQSGVTMAQLHGDETADYGRAVGAARVIKAWRGAPGLEAEAVEYPAAALLLDAYDPRLYGGTGRTVDWDLAARLARQVRLFLAGGLSPDNIGEAVRRVRPFAVDLNSGVESAPGIKDATKLKLLRERLDRI
jgi:phosphoribosylanthranilate isomerase